MKQTYCNPLDLGYRYQHMKEGPRTAGFREGADPTLVSFKGKYYLFVSMSAGFWYSDDLLHWDFHADPDLLIYDYAPDVRQVGDFLYFCASRKGRNCPILRTADPLTEPFTEVSAPFAFWDPDLFCDDDGRVYFYWGCSNTTPIYGVEMDPDTMTPIGEKQELIFGNETVLGYERPGNNGIVDREASVLYQSMKQFYNPETGKLDLPPQMANIPGLSAESLTAMFNAVGKPYIEGAFMTKHNGTYYLQYACPGTQYNTYADGVYTIGVSVVLGAGAGVLQVIGAVVFCHERTLDIGFAHGVEHGSQAFGTQAGDVCHLRRQIQLAGFRVIELLHGLVQHAGFPVHNAVVAGAFVAQYGFIAEDQLLLFTDGGHGVRVHLHAVDGRSIGAAPVEVYPAVIIAEQIRVPESKGRRYFGKRLGQGVSGAQDGTVAPLAAGAEVQEIAHLPHIGGIIVDQQIRVCMEVPVQQVVRIPEARRHGNKEIIFALEGYQRGVCTLPETCCTGAFLHVLVTVAQIKGVTIGLFHRITPWKCPAIHGSAA